MDTHTLQQASPSNVRHGKVEPERRMRTVEEKTKIVKETLVPGVSVAEVARRHGVNANLLFSQISVTVWVALDMMLAKQAADEITIEPRSDEDIETAVGDPAIPSPLCSTPHSREIESI